MRNLFIIILLVACVKASGADEKQLPCASEEYRQFDFWIGEWEVFNPEGKKVGQNTIEKILGNCSLKESWKGASGNVGHSFNIYDRGSKQWHQTWVDNNGLLLQLKGGLEHDSMVLQGETQGKKGTVLNKISWTPIDENVRQVWQVSTDGGETWEIIFNGLYKRKANN